MKPKTSTVFSRLAQLILLASSTAWAQVPAGDLAAHVTEQEVSDSLKAALPFLEDKVASTIKDGASSPIAFHGEAQVRSLFHNYYNLADSSYLYLARQGFILGGSEPILKLGMVVTPGRNTVMWAKTGFSASYQGVNQKPFLQPGVDGDGNEGYSYVVQHHDDNKKIGIFEDMSAGIAIRTKPASFMLKMGAMNWNEASPLSIWKAQPRMFAWEYLPYEIEQPIADYYKYNIAKGEKVGRAAWNKKPFQGIDFSITDIPGDFNAYFLYGASSPYDMYERNSIDMAVDLGYAADSGSIVGTGIGDSYRKHLFYRISKKFNNALTLGFNNGYSFTSDDIVYAGFEWDYTFHTKFDVGLYNSSWSFGEKENKFEGKFDEQATHEKIASYLQDNPGDTITASSLGEGYWIDPKYFSLDAKGTIAEKFQYHVDLGFSMVETTYVTIKNNAPTPEDPILQAALDTAGNVVYTDLANESTYMQMPRGIQSSRTTNGLDAAGFAGYAELWYKSKVDVGIDLFYASKNFYAPFSFVAPIDAFYARGSNLLGAQKFVGSEASPYTQNMVGAGLTVKPNFNWYGHLKFKYGMNSQLDASRDILFLPYRLNGASMVATLNSYYNKWGLGRLTETYDFKNHQGGHSKKGTQAKHPINRIGDESYGSLDDAKTLLSPTSGGMRADAHSVYEGFVPYTKHTDMIFNYFSKSSLVSQKRDLSEIWNNGTRSFEDVRGKIGSINDGMGVRVVDGDNVSFYSMQTGSDTLTVYQSKDTIINGVDTVIADMNKASKEKVSTVSETGFVPQSSKNTFNFAFDWALDIGKYIGYKNDLFLSLYYEVNAAGSGFTPFAVNAENDNVLMMSHYIRSEPAIALTKDFYILGLIGYERWMSNHGWIAETKKDDENNDVLVGFKRSPIEMTDWALGLGFDWDVMKRVSLHTRYKWYTHQDSSIPEVRYNAHAIAFELKAYF